MSSTPFDGRGENTPAKQQTAASAPGGQGASPADQVAGSPPAAEDGPKTKFGARTRAGKFKPGKSGNPKGRPPKPKEQLNEVVLRLLHESVPVSVSGKQVPITMFEALLRSTLVRAIKDPRLSLAFIKMVLSVFELRKAADTQDDDEFDFPVLERFRARELERLRLIAANDADASCDDRIDSLDVDEVSAERST